MDLDVIVLLIVLIYALLGFDSFGHRTIQLTNHEDVSKKNK